MAQSHPRPRRQALGPQEHQSLATGRQMHQDGREAARVPEEARRGHQAPQLIGQGGSSKPHPESRPRACRRMSGRGSRGAERARSLAGGRLPSPRHLAPPPHPTPAEPRGPLPHISDPAWDRGRFRRFFVWELGRLWRDPASQGQGCGPVAAGHIPALRTPRPAPRAGRAPGRARLCPHRPCRFPSAFPETQGHETQLPGADSFPCLHVSCPSSEPSADLGGLASACRAQLEHGVKATARCSARP